MAYVDRRLPIDPLPMYREGDVVRYTSFTTTGRPVMREGVVSRAGLGANQKWSYQIDSNTSADGMLEESSRQNPFVQAPKRHMFPLLIEEFLIETVPDTGSMINAITEEFMGKLSGKINRITGQDDDAVQVGDDSSVRALYQVSLKCRLFEEPGVLYEDQCWSFHVFKRLARGVTIIGRPFLDANAVMTEKAHLLKELTIANKNSVPKCLSIGPVSRTEMRMKIYLDSKLISALPDTGSDLDLISRACADRLDVRVEPLSKADPRIIELADCSIAELSGKVKVQFDTLEPLPSRSTHEWDLMAGSFKRQKRSAPAYDHKVTFYVLETLPHDVTLSQQLLYSLDAFDRHASSMVVVEAKNALQTIFESKDGKRATELSVFDLKQLWKRRVRSHNTKLKDVRSRLDDATSTEAQETARHELRELERIFQDEEARHKEALRAKQRR